MTDRVAKADLHAATLNPVRWPPEFDPWVLRVRYADLADLDDGAMRVHYETYGRNEGRVASRATLREDFIGLIPADAMMLEVGPFCDPTLRGPNIRYFDVLDTDALRARAVEIGRDIATVPAVIHYSPSLTAAADAGFDALFSCHNIEHHPNLIGHLQEAARVLHPGGEYMMVVPDRRYCFDHFLPDLTLQDVLGAHVERRTRHTAADVIEHRAFTCHNDMLRHWQGDHGLAPDGLDGRIDYALKEIDEAQGGYIDVHAWQFTPSSFRVTMDDLYALGLSPFRVIRVYDTPYGRNEFTAVLTLQAPE